MTQREITFDIDKYKEPVLLNTKETIAKTILNALLMVPGNLPSNPLLGANITQYLYKNYDDIDSVKITNDLRMAIGTTLADTTIDEVIIEHARMSDGTDAAIVVINLRMPDNREADSLVVMLKKTDDRVHFNYKFMSDVLDTIS